MQNGGNSYINKQTTEPSNIIIENRYKEWHNNFYATKKWMLQCNTRPISYSRSRRRFSLEVMTCCAVFAGARNPLRCKAISNCLQFDVALRMNVYISASPESRPSAIVFLKYVLSDFTALKVRSVAHVVIHQLAAFSICSRLQIFSYCCGKMSSARSRDCGLFFVVLGYCEEEVLPLFECSFWFRPQWPDYSQICKTGRWML